MKLQTQRWIDRWVGQLLCAGLSVWARLTGNANPKPPAQVRHVLVILLSEMGSIVLAGPMFAALRAQYPGATLHVLQLKKNQEVSRMLGLAADEHLHALDDASGVQLIKDIWRFMRTMRALPLDVVVDCELFSRISALLSYLSGAKLRAGFTPHTQEGLYRGSFINRAIPYNPYQHISKQFLSLVDALAAAPGSASMDQGEPLSAQSSTAAPVHKAAPIRDLPARTELSVDFTADELNSYRAKLAADHPASVGRQLVLLYAGGGILPERAWPADHYARVAQGLVAAGHAVGLIGLKDDAALAADLKTRVASDLCLNLTGYTRSIRELLMLFHAADLLITNDGGPGHFATLTPIQTMVFFGPETGKLYGPLPGLRGAQARIFESGIACSPCLSAYNHRLTFCDGDNQCLKRIAPDPVLHDALQMLQESRAATGMAAGVAPVTRPGTVPGAATSA